jgi:hypothetical protein
MVCLDIVDRGDRLEVRRVAVNILNKQQWIAQEGKSFSIGVGRDRTFTPTTKCHRQSTLQEDQPLAQDKTTNANEAQYRHNY